MSSDWCELSFGRAKVLKVGSGEDRGREPRQDRKVATVNGVTVSRREAWLEPSSPKPSHRLGEVLGTAGLI